ncbi:MAG: hypothetical protein K1X67_08080 [Fimbriimonadaceae bacterium]|nr:hypothetical protein [Fimbriimonadaceae bacterium]
MRREPKDEPITDPSAVIAETLAEVEDVSVPGQGFGQSGVSVHVDHASEDAGGTPAVRGEG